MKLRHFDWNWIVDSTTVTPKVNLVVTALEQINRKSEWAYDERMTIRSSNRIQRVKQRIQRIQRVSSQKNGKSYFDFDVLIIKSTIKRVVYNFSSSIHVLVLLWDFFQFLIDLSIEPYSKYQTSLSELCIVNFSIHANRCRTFFCALFLRVFIVQSIAENFDRFDAFLFVWQSGGHLRKLPTYTVFQLSNESDSMNHWTL